MPRWKAWSFFSAQFPAVCAGLLQTKRAARAHPYYGDFPPGLKAGTSREARIEQLGRTDLFRLTSYPDAVVFGLYVYPRCERTSRIAAGHPGSADSAHADFRRAARPRHRARHPTDVGRGTAGGARCALSGAATAGGRSEEHT